MAITYQSAGTVATSAGSSISVAYPASVAAGDALVLVIGMKPSTANSGNLGGVPDGWTFHTSVIGGGYGATLGADTGNTILFLLYRPASGSETGSLAVPLSNNNVSWGQMYRLSKDVSTDLWAITASIAEDTTSGNVSATFDADVRVTAGDLVFVAMCTPTDVGGGSQFSAEAVSMPGVTFGTVTEISEPTSSLNNDIGGVVCHVPVSSGTSSGSPATFTATAGGTTTNVRGPLLFIRTRQVPNFSTIVEDFEDTTYAVTPSGVWARSNTSSAGGSWSLKAPATADNGASVATFTVPSGAVYVKFSYRVSSEAGFDTFQFYYNDTFGEASIIQFVISGDSGWLNSLAYDVMPGATLNFSYEKDSSGASFLDTAFIDDLTFWVPPPAAAAVTAGQGSATVSTPWVQPYLPLGGV